MSQTDWLLYVSLEVEIVAAKLDILEKISGLMAIPMAPAAIPKDSAIVLRTVLLLRRKED